MSDAGETANCRVTCITHISEKDFQMLLTLKKGYTYIYIAPTACTRSHIATTMQKIIITKIRKHCPLKLSYVAPRVVAICDLVHDVETIFHLSYVLTASNSFRFQLRFSIFSISSGLRIRALITIHF